MKHFLLFVLGGVALVGVCAMASALSSDARAMLFGLAFGLLAGLPSALLAMSSRQQEAQHRLEQFTVIYPSPQLPLVSKSRLLLEVRQ